MSNNNKRKKSYYNRDTKRNKNGILESGMKGFIVTCNNRLIYTIDNSYYDLLHFLQNYKYLIFNQYIILFNYYLIWKFHWYNLIKIFIEKKRQ